MRAHVVWLESLTSEVSRDIHRVAADLRPVALDDLGLTRALTALAAELSRRHSVCFDVQEVGIIGRLPANIENAIFRIVQEAFTNVLKHASAATASVILEKRDQAVRIVVEDDGCGFEQGRIDSDGAPAWGDKLGLSSIRERLATLGGSFRVETDAGHGVSLFIDIPLDQEMVMS
jgi:signal transduction histidine kinase